MLHRSQPRFAGVLQFQIPPHRHRNATPTMLTNGCWQRFCWRLALDNLGGHLGASAPQKTALTGMFSISASSCLFGRFWIDGIHCVPAAWSRNLRCHPREASRCACPRNRYSALVTVSLWEETENLPSTNDVAAAWLAAVLALLGAPKPLLARRPL